MSHPEMTEIISVLQTGSAWPVDVVRRISPGEMSDELHAARREVAPIDHA
ncbi:MULTISPECIES: hypothetical protein [Aeromonas]|nr:MULTISPECIES: hypothetical protein [Aeromonas]MCX4044839.1 hypothetical protein [Aeromonas veronii]QWZ82499.1 hypothetical protein I6L44_06245 [Aeromonas sp. FDAARGOS 1414]HDN9005188.1 hypothetical protein [Aeromonas veronii]